MIFLRRTRHVASMLPLMLIVAFVLTLAHQLDALQPELKAAQQQRVLAKQKAEATARNQIPNTQSGAPTIPSSESDEAESARRKQEIEIQGKILYWTRILAIAAIALGVAQGVLLYFQTSHTGTAATAARTSADAVMLSERAYISISHHPPGIDIDEMAAAQAGDEDFGGWHDVRFKFGMRNHGNTPATITDISIAHFVAPATNIPPPPSGPGTGEHLFLVKDDVANDERTFKITNTERAQLGLTLRFWVMGYVDYIDAFNIRRRAGYARFYDPSIDQDSLYFNTRTGFDEARWELRNNLPFVTEDGYNYDRKREKGEGNDWDEPQK